METASAPSRLLRLHRMWQAFGLIAVLFARILLRLERAGGQGVRAHAAELEVRIRVAAIALNADIADLAETDAPETEEERGALAHMQVISFYLIALVIFLREMQTRLPAKGCGMFVPEAAFAGLQLSPAACRKAAHVPYLDSS